VDIFGYFWIFVVIWCDDGYGAWVEIEKFRGAGRGCSGSAREERGIDNRAFGVENFLA